MDPTVLYSMNHTVWCILYGILVGLVQDSGHQVFVRLEIMSSIREFLSKIIFQNFSLCLIYRKENQKMKLEVINIECQYSNFMNF